MLLSTCGGDGLQSLLRPLVTSQRRLFGFGVLLLAQLRPAVHRVDVESSPCVGLRLLEERWNSRRKGKRNWQKRANPDYSSPYGTERLLMRLTVCDTNS